METLAQDIRIAVRRLCRTPSFTFVAILTLTLGIGGNTAIFSVVDAALVRPLPYPAAGEIVRIYTPMSRDLATASPPDFVDWRAGARSFRGMAAIAFASYDLVGRAGAEEIDAANVTEDFFSVLGVRAELGRPLDERDARSGSEHSVVLSDAVWHREFHGDSSIIGQNVKLDGVPYIVVGVMPAEFEYPQGAELWTPQVFSSQELATQRGAHYLNVVARIREGVSIDQASADLRIIWAQLALKYPTTDVVRGGSVVPLRTTLVGDAKPALLVLIAAVGLVLLIACTNVANLLLVRALRRQREVLIRAALGASRYRQNLDIMAEALLLAVGGGIAGLGLAIGGTHVLAAIRPDDRILSTAVVDWRVLGVTLGLSVVTGVAFGLIAALQSSYDATISSNLRAEGRSASVGIGVRHAKRWLAVVEVALAVVLVTGAGLLLRSFLTLRSVDPGFVATQRVTFDVSLPDVKYDTPEKCAAMLAEFLGKVRALPGIQSAAATTGVPFSQKGYSMSMYAVDGHQLSTAEQDRLSTEVRRVTGDYFHTMGIPMRAGRSIAETDRAGAAQAVVVNEATAKLLAPGQTAIGHTVTIGTTFGLNRGRATGQIVGIAQDAKGVGLAAAPVPELYLSFDQYPADYASLIVHTTDQSERVISGVRQALDQIDPEVPIYHVHTMDDLLASSIARPRFLTVLVGLFAGVAVVLAVIGLYGVIAYGVGERTREIGIRIALGAQVADVLQGVLRDGFVLGITGLSIGLVASLGAVRGLRGLLYGIHPFDGLTFMLTSAGILAAVMLAAWFPARRAARLDPVQAIRSD